MVSDFVADAARIPGHPIRLRDYPVAGREDRVDILVLVCYSAPAR